MSEIFWFLLWPWICVSIIGLILMKDFEFSNKNKKKKE